jgi:hypothetical protein
MRPRFGVIGLWAGFAIIGAVAAAAGCALEGASQDAGAVGPARALFTVPRSAQPLGEYYELPFPNALRVRENGTLDLGGHERSNALIADYLDLMSLVFDGFGPNQASFARFSAPIDPTSLPATPEASRSAAASVYLVDLGPSSPSRGERVPVRVRFQAKAGEAIGPASLRVLPYPGFSLRPKNPYALVISARVRATDGSAVTRSADFDAIMSGAATEPALAAAQLVYAPLLAWLDEPGGDERADVVAASIYETGDPTALVARARTVIERDLPVPSLTAPAFSDSGDGYQVFTATAALPIFQAGSAPYLDRGGNLVVDGAGDPVVQRQEDVRVAMSFPDGTVPAGGWPLVIYAHGTGGDFKSFVRDGTARRFAAAGFAVLGIDQVMNGTRYDGGPNPGASAVEVAFYNFNNPIAGRDNSRQNAIDHFSLVRLAKTAVVTEAGPGGRSHRFDPGRFYFMGHSQGGTIGPLFVAFEPAIRGAIFSGAGGLLYYALLLKTEPLSIPDLLMSFIRDNPLDEFNNVLALVQMFIEPADPINYARRIALDPPPGLSPRDVFQSQGFVDHYTPVPAIAALGLAFGGHLVGPLVQAEPGFELAGRAVLTAPVSGNVNGRTVVLRQYPATSSDGHFVVFDVPDAARQSVEFLRTLDRTGTATLVP